MATNPLNEPIDQLHEECLAARDWIRCKVMALLETASNWQPGVAPQPEKGSRTTMKRFPRRHYT